MIPELNIQIKRTSLVDSVYESLLEAIVTGNLAAGTELNSVQLSQQLDVSRTPIKEAIKLLIHDGLVEQVNNHKAQVAQFSRQDIIEIYDLRKELEGAAVEKATKLIDDKDLKILRAEAETLFHSQSDVDWTKKTIDLDIQFHKFIAQSCGNKRLQKEVCRYRLLVSGFCRMTGTQAVLLKALGEHLKIIDAIDAGRPSAARKAMEAHIEARLKTVLEMTDIENK